MRRRVSLGIRGKLWNIVELFGILAEIQGKCIEYYKYLLTQKLLWNIILPSLVIKTLSLSGMSAKSSHDVSYNSPKVMRSGASRAS